MQLWTTKGLDLKQCQKSEPTHTWGCFLTSTSVCQRTCTPVHTSVCMHACAHTKRLKGSVRVIEIVRDNTEQRETERADTSGPWISWDRHCSPNFFTNLSIHPPSIHWLLFLRTPLKSFIPIGLLRMRPTIGSKRIKDIWSTPDLYIPYMSQSDLWNAKRKVILLYGGRSRSRASSLPSESRHLNPVPATSPYFYVPLSNCTKCWCEASKHGE